MRLALDYRAEEESGNFNSVLEKLLKRMIWKHPQRTSSQSLGVCGCRFLHREKKNMDKMKEIKTESSLNSMKLMINPQAKSGNTAENTPQ